VRRVIIVFILLMMGIAGYPLTLFSETAEEALRRAFPDFKYDVIRESDMKGIYEVILGTEIAYFIPEKGYLIFGEIIGKGGTNITQQKRNAIISEKVKSIPLDKAIKVGKGRHTVIEFTDPDCPYSRRAAEFFRKRTDVTEYVFFLPLPMHRDAENKVRYIICSENRGKAYEDVMGGKLDNKRYEVCKRQDVEDLLKLHKALSKKIGVDGTPFFIINNRVVNGANFPEIEKSLK